LGDETLVLISIFLPAATVMDVNPVVIQLVDGLEFPVLPRNPSVSDPLNVWYIKVFQYNPLDSPQFLLNTVLSIPACLYLRITSFL
jgi:hypothetical protein